MTLRLWGTFALLTLAAAAQAAPVTPGNFVILRVGDGSAALSNAATAFFLDEYTPLGSLVQSIAVPTTTSGSNRRMTLSGSSTAEGGLTISPDGRFVAFGGYDAAPGTASIATTAVTSVNRVAGVLDLTTGLIDSSTVFTAAFNAQSIRSAVLDGTNVWAVGGTSGVQATTLGNVGASTQVSATPTNIRRVIISDGQLRISAATAGFQGVSTVGTGLPTGSGNTTTLLPGMPGAGTPSAYDHWLADPNTLYVADDRAISGTNNISGGVQKWTFAAGTWTYQYTLNTGISQGVRGLTGLPGATNQLFGITANNQFVTLSDTGSGAGFSVLATGATNTALRGIALMAPEPGALALLALGLAAGAIGLRRRKL